MRWYWFVQYIGLGVVGLMLSLVAVTVGLGHVLPEGDQIAFMYDAREADSDWGIYLKDLRYQLTVPLIQSEVQERYPEWSPDGQQLAYHANPRAQRSDGTNLPPTEFDYPYDAFVLDIPSNSIRQLPISTNPLLLNDNQAMFAWSPDGQRMAFHTGRGISFGRPYRIAISDLAGNNFYTIPGSELVGEAIYASWSPDGRWLSFVLTNLQTDSYSRLYIIEVGSSLGDPVGEPILVLTKSGDILFPDWSPDGQQITFVLSQDSALQQTATPGIYTQTRTNEVYIINTDGTGLRQVTNSPAGSQNSNPAWLPDGSGIMFASDRGSRVPGAPTPTGPITLASREYDYDLYIIDTDGRNLRRISNLPGDEMAPDWRPGK